MVRVRTSDGKPGRHAAGAAGRVAHGASVFRHPSAVGPRTPAARCRERAPREGGTIDRGVGQLVVVSLVVMGISYTIARERIFEPLRRRCGGRATWLGYLVSCPYCLSYWVAFVIVPLTRSYYVPVWPALGWFATVLDWFFSSVLVASLAAFLRVGFFLVDESQGLLRRREKEIDRELDGR
jgi:hypothetical protein